jgi:two-component system, chemotaxis family, sensor kinase CheA
VDPLEQFKTTFFEECSELLAAAEMHLASIEAGEADGETLHAIFRAIHSIKGGAGVFGFQRLVGFAHVFETALDALRAGRINATPEIVSIFIRANDALSDFVRAAQQDETLPDDFGAMLLHALEQAAGAGTAEHPPVLATAAATGGGQRRFRIDFAPASDMLRKANEPMLLLRELRRLGELTVAANLDRLPPLSEMAAEDAYLSWTMELVGEVARERVLEVFEFVEDDCKLTVEEIAPHDSSPVILPVAVAAAPVVPVAPSEPSKPLPSGGHTSVATSIRVDLDRVDRLVNLVGELVTTQAMLAQQAREFPAEQYPAFVQGLEAISQHTRELQESVMAIRAQPVKSVFARLPKMVRELAATLSKEIRLVTTGESTEIDKTVIEQLGDPLTHMIRNAIDHGIETPEQRVAAGKPAQGTIHVSAEHRSGRILIEISDDGRGIDRRRVLDKAKERGLIASTAVLTDEEIDNLIFLPGFSTAAIISDVSGRGVGMDVVKRNIQALGGRIVITSTPGQGSRFTLSLPLTLAVLDGMIVAVGGESYIVPITSIVESFRPAASAVRSIVNAGEVVAMRGEQVRLAYLHRIFGVPDAVTDPAKGIVIIVETDGSSKLGLVVDELLGQQQVVIKSMEKNYGQIDGIAAATILGSGKVALILDVVALRSIGNRPTTASRAPRGAAGISETSARVH